MALLESKTKWVGRTAPAFQLLGTDGKKYSLDNFGDSKGLAIIFTCNHCPYAIASWPLIINLQANYPEIDFLCINGNDPDYVPADSYEKMQELATELNLQFPYVFDADQSVAKAYDAQCTPDNYLFKNTGESFELFFQGRFTDNRQNPTQVTEKNFEDHINKLLNNKISDDTRPPSMGCSIKWK